MEKRRLEFGGKAAARIKQKVAANSRKRKQEKKANIKGGQKSLEGKCFENR